MNKTNMNVVLNYQVENIMKGMLNNFPNLLIELMTHQIGED